MASARKTAADAEEKAIRLQAQEDVRLKKQEGINEKKAIRIAKMQDVADKKRQKINEKDFKRTLSKAELKTYNLQKKNEVLEAAQKLIAENEEENGTSESEVDEG